MACRITELVVDSRDPGALAAWWAAVLGHEVVGTVEPLPTSRSGTLRAP
jgi:hypothetical protein